MYNWLSNDFKNEFAHGKQLRWSCVRRRTARPAGGAFVDLVDGVPAPLFRTFLQFLRDSVPLRNQTSRSASKNWLMSDLDLHAGFSHDPNHENDVSEMVQGGLNGCVPVSPQKRFLIHANGDSVI